MDVLYRYHPKPGAFVAGVPQRDLTADDLAAISPLDLRTGIDCGMYEAVKTAPDPKPESKPEKVEAKA